MSTSNDTTLLLCPNCNRFLPTDCFAFNKYPPRPDSYKDWCRFCYGPLSYRLQSQKTAESTKYKRSRFWRDCLVYWDYKCAVCRRQSDDQYTIAADHWIPFHKGGVTAMDNIIPLCSCRNNRGGINACNRSKHVTDGYEWLYDRLGVTLGRKKESEILRYFRWVNQFYT